MSQTVKRIVATWLIICTIGAVGLLANVLIQGPLGVPWIINLYGAAEVEIGRSDDITYRASSSALVTTALYNLTIEAPAAQSVRLLEYCVGLTNATAGAGVTITVNRRTTASSAGVALTNEGTGADVVAKMDNGDGSFGGIARRTGTLGTIGATLDQQGLQVGEVGVGTADALGPAPYCKRYGDIGEKSPIVPAGTANGISINVSAPGAGGLAFGSISATFTVF